MSSENPSYSSDKSFLPLLFLSLSLMTMFLWQLTEISKNKAAIADAQKNLTELEGANTPAYSDAANKARNIEGILNNLAGDLWDLSKKDESAKKIVDKYGIQYHAPATPAASGTSSL
jgi:hypothetical protein